MCPQLRAQVGAGRCLSVDCSLKARQQATAVIRHFNVRVTHSDIFSRCQVGAACPLLALGRCGSPQALTGDAREALAVADGLGVSAHVSSGHCLVCAFSPLRHPQTPMPTARGSLAGGGGRSLSSVAKRWQGVGARMAKVGS